MKVKNIPIIKLPWYKKPFPRIVALEEIKPGIVTPEEIRSETVFLALSLKNSDEFYGINITSFKTTHPAQNIDVYKVKNFVEYDGTISLLNE